LWEGIKGAVDEFNAEGGVINTELFRTSISIKGTFNGPEDGFDPGRHTIRLTMRPGSLLKASTGKLKIKRQNPCIRTFINSVSDIKTGSVNDKLSPGRNLRINGQRL
jgi:hypothetical protein